MLTIEPLEKKHLLSFVPIKGQEEEFQTLCEITFGKHEMHNFCALDDNGMVLLFGMKEKWAGVYDTYTIFSDLWRPVYYKTMSRVAKGYFDYLDYDRIEHLVKCSRPWTDKIAEIFGFEYRTTLRKYINGNDYKLYEIVNGSRSITN